MWLACAALAFAGCVEDSDDAAVDDDADAAAGGAGTGGSGGDGSGGGASGGTGGGGEGGAGGGEGGSGGAAGGAGGTGGEPPSEPACADGADNDDDGLTDLEDPGCEDDADEDEADPALTPACADGIDNDADEAIDYPADDDCVAAGDPEEGQACADGIAVLDLGPDGGEIEIEPADGPAAAAAACGEAQGRETVVAVRLTEPSFVTFSAVSADRANETLVHIRTSCRARASEIACGVLTSEDSLPTGLLEPGIYYVFVASAAEGAVPPTVTLTVRVQSGIRACNNGEDDDGDGTVDLADPGCGSSLDDDETDPEDAPACADGEDNDGDGATDYPDDDDCAAAGGDREAPLCENDEPIATFGEGRSQVAVLLAAGEGPGEGEGLEGRCGGFGDRERVYEIRVDTLSRLTATFTKGNDVFGFVQLYLRARCDDPESEVRCTEGRDEATLSSGRLELGSYTLVVDANDGPEAIRGDLVVDVVPVERAACEDGVDNDDDGRVDLEDPGCARPLDEDESDEPDEVPECSDGEDNDEDGAVDWPDDADCAGAGDDSEETQCTSAPVVGEVGLEGGVFQTDTNGEENSYEAQCAGGARGGENVIVVRLDGPARVTATIVEGSYDTSIFLREGSCDDGPEIACDDDGGEGTLSRLSRELPAGTYFLFVDGFNENSGTATVEVEVASLIVACNDGEDNDEDGLVDLEDPGCERGRDEDETDPDVAPECADGLDNDEDGAVDFPDDPECRAAGGTSESLGCGLEGIELQAFGPEGGVALLEPTGAPPQIESPCAPPGEFGEYVIAVETDGPAFISLIRQGAGDFPVSIYRADGCDEPVIGFECQDTFVPGEGLGVEVPEAGLWYFVVDPFEAEPLEIEVIVESLIVACNDGEDNDEDGLVDLEDPGCERPRDEDETDPDELPECGDGIDNDEDGATDFPDDAQCSAAGDGSESRVCPAGLRVVQVGPQGLAGELDPPVGEPQFESPCAQGPGDIPETIIAVTTEGPAEIVFENQGFGPPFAVSLTDACDPGAPVLQCGEAFGPGPFFGIPVEAAGTYYFVVDPFEDGPISLAVQVIEFEPPPCVAACERIAGCLFTQEPEDICPNLDGDLLEARERAECQAFCEQQGGAQRALLEAADAETCAETRDAYHAVWPSRALFCEGVEASMECGEYAARVATCGVERCPSFGEVEAELASVFHSVCDIALTGLGGLNLPADAAGVPMRVNAETPCDDPEIARIIDGWLIERPLIGGGQLAESCAAETLPLEAETCDAACALLEPCVVDGVENNGTREWCRANCRVSDIWEPRTECLFELGEDASCQERLACVADPQPEPVLEPLPACRAVSERIAACVTGTCGAAEDLGPSLGAGLNWLCSTVSAGTGLDDAAVEALGIDAETPCDDPALAPFIEGLLVDTIALRDGALAGYCGEAGPANDPATCDAACDALGQCIPPGSGPFGDPEFCRFACATENQRAGAYPCAAEVGPMDCQALVACFIQ
jgi:hypothetical protein